MGEGREREREGVKVFPFFLLKSKMDFLKKEIGVIKSIKILFEMVTEYIR